MVSSAESPAQSGSSPIFFPAGSRLGIRKPAELEPLAEDTRNLVSSDFTFHVMFWETLALGGAYDNDVWNDRPNDVELLFEQAVSPAEQRRFFEHTTFKNDADHSWFNLVVRTNDAAGRPDWFGRVTFMTKLMTQSTGARARWRETIEAIVASVTLRPPLSVSEMLAEHRLAMDLTGLHPHHFGDKLIIGLSPPATPGERRINDCYIAMEQPPASLFWDRSPTAEELAATIAEYQAGYRLLKHDPYTQWTSNDIHWLLETEWPLEGTDTHMRGAQGVSRQGVIELKSYCRRPDRAEIGAVLERVARSVVFLR